jgi:hypothetical protein
MICRNKFSNLYTSYEIMGGSHLKAFFGMNVKCSMNEVLKFPGFFEMSDLSEYLGSTTVIVKVRNQGKIIRKTENYYGDPYESENKEITPEVVSLQGVEDGIVYFFFHQHFDGHENNPPYVKRKYKFQVGVIDVSVQKAIEAREQIIEFSRGIRSFEDPEELEEIEEELIRIVELAEKIRQKQNEVYQSVLSGQYDKSFNFIDELTTQFKKDIKYMNSRISFYGRNIEKNDKTDRPDYSGINPYSVIEKEFKKIVNFNFKSQYRNLLPINNLPSLPTVPIELLLTATVNYDKLINLKAKILNDLPVLKAGYSKNTKFEQKQSLQQRAEKYNLNFVDSVLDNKMSDEITLTTDETNLPVYILFGHNDEVVTVPNFVLLSEVQENLLTNSSYLCKTSMVEAENQYFILET